MTSETPTARRPRSRKPRAAAIPATLLVLALLLTTGAAVAAPSAAGRWEGSIRLPTTELAVTVDLSRGEDGWIGDVDIPAQGARDLPLTGIEVEGDAVRFTIAGVPGEPTFHGTLADDGATLAGDFTQAGGSFPFELERSGEAEAAERVDSAEALAGFEEWMAAELEAWKVPGAAVAVVRDGEVVLAEGYGLRHREAGEPVDADTLFAIGSATKAFTATVLATLVDDGEVGLDEPVRTYLPDFQLQDEWATDHITVGDLLSHTSGLPRHDLVWYGSDASREELYHRLRHLQPSEDLRAAFQYQNLMYMTAGHLAATVAGTSWEELVRRRLFAPLGMERSNLDAAAMETADNAAHGYEKKDAEEDSEEDGGSPGEASESADGEGGEPEETVEPMPLRDIDAVGPAGSINSSARDMARWLLLNLGSGEVDGTRVVSAAALRALHRPKVVVEGGLFSALFQQPEMPYLLYGRGWFVQPYRGHEMVHHGGNIDGFSARVTFLPRDGLGVVVLTNLNGTQLPTVVTLHLVDRFLGVEPADWSGRFQALQEQVEAAMEGGDANAELDRRQGTSPTHPLDEYTGTYTHPAYGALEIGRDGDGLTFSFHTLESPLEHWHYDVFRTTEEPVEGVKVVFQTDLSGHVSRLAAPLQTGVNPIQFERRPAAELSDPEVLAEYPGDYELLGGRVEVRLRDDGTLTVTVPGQPTYELTPERPDRFSLGEEEGYAVRFVRDEDGAVRELVFLQPQGNVPARRLDAADGDEDGA